ncbi:MAG: PA2169 family four-helix-bundle protein [Parafilimonas sp.]
MQNTELTNVLNDLVRINNDRIEGYEHAMDEAKNIDVDLQAIFQRMIEESRKYKSELVQAIQSRGGEADSNETTNSGKVYRVWMDLKNAFTGKDRKSVLESCEFGEDAAQKAYQHALESDAVMDTDIRQLISKQKAELKSSHDLIKSYRDMHATVSKQMDKLSNI